MFRLVRRLAILSALSVALNSAFLSAQSQPTAPQSTPQNPTPLPQQPTPPQSPTTAQPPAQQPGTLPEQPAPPASATPQQAPAPVYSATPSQPATAPTEAAPSEQSNPAPSPKHPKSAKKNNDKPINRADIHNASLWRDPGNIGAKDMFYGDGGNDGQPVAPFKFISEDMNGTNPKFDVEDAGGKKWRVKLAEEARPEVVASRLLWAVGYYVNDDYLLHVATIQGLSMKRGGKLVHGDQVIDARFARKPGKDTKVAIWEWKDSPFRDTREFNGLRVMMAVLNNWDLKDVNNAVYTNKKTGHQTFLVSDIGATFATNALQTSRAKDKGNVNSYVDSKFITRTTASTVDFGTPSAPTGVLIKTAGMMAADYERRKGFDWIGENIPREDARWIGSMLGQLSHEQLVDAFRAGNFPPESIDQYVTVLENRIAQLKAL